MRRLLLMICMAAGVIAVSAQTTKDARLKEIRAKYAEAKEKIAQNGKDGRSPKELKVQLNRMEDEEVYLYDMEELNYYFDETTDNDIVKKHPYFIVENWSNHGHTRYREVLLDEHQRVMFSYTHAETDAGFVVESRYYFDTQGNCIEERHNTDNSWSTSNSDMESAKRFVKLFGMLTYNGYFSALDHDKRQKPVTPMTERLSHIRKVYAQAKERIAENAEKDDPDALMVTLKEYGDDRPPRTTVIDFAITLEECYFISSHTTGMGYDGYAEYLFEPSTSDLIFSYTKGLEEGEQHEWRYYYDENGQCIETKSNSEETDDGFYDKRAAKDLMAIYQFLTKED